MDDYSDDIATTGSLPIGGSVTGELESPYDRDWFVIAFEAGKVYELVLSTAYGGGSGGTLGEAVYAIYDPDLWEVAYASVAYDYNTVFADVTGTHFVEVQAEPFFNAEGPDTGTYTLTAEEVGTHVPASVETEAEFTLGAPQPLDFEVYDMAAGWVRATLEMGQVYRLTGVSADAYSWDLYIDLYDAQGDRVGRLGEFWGPDTDITFSAFESGTHYIGYDGYAFSDATLTLEEIAAPEGDVGGGFSQATPLEIGAEITGDFEFLFDLDLYEVTLTAGQSYAFTLTPFDQGFTFDADPFLAIYDAAGAELFYDDTIYYLDPGEVRSGAVEVAETGTYYIGVGTRDDLYFFNNYDYRYRLITVEVSPLVLDGTEGADSLTGDLGTDLLSGFGGDDTLKGAEGGDTILGGAGQDEIAAGTGDDSVDGGAGNDNIGGGPGDDTLTGGAGENQIAGGQGDDLIDGGALRDLLWGGNGSDTIDGGAGDDQIGAGRDGDSIAAGTGDDLVGAGQGADVVDAGAGNDTVWAGGFDDTVTGGGGDDSLKGGWGDDVLDGGAGDDTLEANRGEDSLTGGDGADTFVFRFAAYDNSFASVETNAITDFENGTDRIAVAIVGQDIAGLEIVSETGLTQLVLGEDRFEIVTLNGTILTAEDFDFT
ncbi:calcium-binding protein [Aestuariicoccus sp. MJ-SS9]|uniref:calcium-binding protein n=1 Tax=Aestuariicoccus sp. MJ-SS9 TaxID=3079855 RepID=UPI00291374E4|nr:calcium-binding protein [Aestuariicoccus sp. MJ-SS9]MDU8913716.1 calcium-binding protein [Aestuariicoccus sp. MJ-SS9]